VVSALSAALVAATPAPAQVRTVDDPDTVGDVITFNDDDAAVPAPERTLNDVSNTTLTHGARRVAIKVDYVDLKKRAGGDYQSLFIVMKTNEGVRRYVSVKARRGHWSGDVETYNGQSEEVRCPVRHSIDYEVNVMRLTLPRRCVNNPRWVTFRVSASAQGDDGYFADDALSDSPIGSQDDQDLGRSDRVYRVAASEALGGLGAHEARRTT
jgi:hypothetical protein